jgi:prepilin-type N-terminal cleavage/methylation domain-containing protein
MFSSTPPNKNKGFTLIELLVVISIIALLSAIVLASLNSARMKGRVASVQVAIDQTKKALQLYWVDNGGFPEDVQDLVAGYIGEVDESIMDYIPSGCTGEICDSYSIWDPSTVSVASWNLAVAHCSDIGFTLPTIDQLVAGLNAYKANRNTDPSWGGFADGITYWSSTEGSGNTVWFANYFISAGDVDKFYVEKSETSLQTRCLR